MYDFMNNQRKFPKNQPVDSGLEFKTNKKRSSKRSSRSKSNLTSADTHYNQYDTNPRYKWDALNTDQNNKMCTDRYGQYSKFQVQDKTNQNFDYGKLKKQQYNNKQQPNSRTPKKLRQQQSYTSNSSNWGFKIPALNFTHSFQENKKGSEQLALSQFDRNSYKNFQIKYDQYYNSFNKIKNKGSLSSKCSLENSPREFGRTYEFGSRRQNKENENKQNYKENENKQNYKENENKQNFSSNSNQHQGHHRTRTEDLCLSSTYSGIQFDDKFPNNKNFKKSNNFMNKIVSINYSLTDQQLRSFKLKDFQLGLCSGQDMFGKIYPARHTKTGMVVCLKQVSKRQVQFQLDKFIESLKIQCFSSKDYIVSIYGFFGEGNKIYIIMEYHNEGNLFYTLKSMDNQLKPYQILSYFITICRSIEQLHSNSILYRNLKAEKLSLVHDTCKISNLNWSARQINQKPKAKCNFMTDLEYSAPQLLENNGKYTKQAEIWAIGILFHEIYYGVTPTFNMSSNQAKKHIINGKLKLDDGPCKVINDLLARTLQKDPKLRPTIYEIISLIEQAQKKQQISQTGF